MPYRDTGGVWTIGYGRTHNIDHKKPTTKEAENEWLKGEVAEIANHLRRIVKVPLTQGQFDALILWGYNVGRGAVAKSTLIKKLNEGLYSQIPDQLRRWSYVKGVQSAGLQNRRKAEIAIWLRS